MFGSQDQANRLAAARGVTGTKAAPTRRLRTAAAGIVCAAAVMLPLTAAADAQAAPMITPTFTPLTLVNGWTSYGSGTASPAASNISGIIHLKGAIMTNGTNPVPFTLPTGDRPAARVYVPVDMCGASNGRLDITPDGVTRVEPEGSNWSNAQCFVSLDGVTFAKSAYLFTSLTSVNGWTSYGGGTASPAARIISGIEYLRGAIMTTGTNPTPFTLPTGDAPVIGAEVPSDLCSAASGRLMIFSDGAVDVDAYASFGDAQCFTSLDGVSFATSASSFTPLTPKNGWTSSGVGWGKPAVRLISGIVHLEGAIRTAGTNPVAFTLPVADRPTHDVYITVILGGDGVPHTNGRLHITPSGSVTVQTESGFWPSAQSFTSLDGASFAR